MWRAIRRCPLTAGLTTALIATSVVLETHPGELPRAVAWASTNVHNLGTHPIGALLASVAVTITPPWPGVVLVAVSCYLVERRLGTWRTAAIALAGQVIATILTEYGAAALAATHLTVASSPTRPDVGLSYVMYALLGAAALLLRPRWRRPAFAVLVVAVGVPLAIEPGMTTAGHVLALGCGAAVLAATTTRPRSESARRGQGSRYRIFLRLEPHAAPPAGRSAR